MSKCNTLCHDQEIPEQMINKVIVFCQSGNELQSHFYAPANHCENFYPHMEKTLDSGEQWPTQQNHSKTISTTHSGGHKRNPEHLKNNSPPLPHLQSVFMIQQ